MNYFSECFFFEIISGIYHSDKNVSTTETTTIKYLHILSDPLLIIPLNKVLFLILGLLNNEVIVEMFCKPLVILLIWGVFMVIFQGYHLNKSPYCILFLL